METCGTCKWAKSISANDVGRHEVGGAGMDLIECHGQPCAATYPTQRISVYGVGQSSDMACIVYQPREE